jgi:pimeloyl-ACP methyl ester carboxylesterase
MQALRYFGIGLCALALACGDETSGRDDGGDDERSGPDAGEAALAMPPGAQGLQLRQSFGPLAAGAETHKCQYFVLPDRAIDVARFEHTYTLGGHHIILYPTKLSVDDVAEHPGVFDCEDVPNRIEAGLAYVGAATSGELAYPEGVARRFEANEVVLLESHMLNVQEHPIDVDYRLNLWFADEPVEHRVGTIFFYDNTLYIPPASSGSAQMSCRAPEDIHVLGLIPHMHVRGTHYESFLQRADQSAPEPLVSTDDWAELKLAAFDPPLLVSEGDRIEFRCEYENAADHPVVEGGSKNDNEMCLMIGYYYPKLDTDFELCLNPGSGPVFEGDLSCGDAFGCFMSAADPIEAERCVTQTCEASSAASNDFFSCVTLRCFLEGQCTGTASDPDCQSCAIAECSDAIGPCFSASCEEEPALDEIEIEHTQITVGSMVFDARAAGPNSGELVLLLHGFPQTSYEWRSQLQALARAGYRAVAPDQRGYSAGARPTEVEAYQIINLMTDALGMVDALGYERFHVVGHDWGGAVAWSLAGIFADRVLSLTAVSTPHPAAFAAALSDTTSCQYEASAYFDVVTQPEVPASTFAGGAFGDAFEGLPEEAANEYVEQVISKPEVLDAALNWYRANIKNRAPTGSIGPVSTPTLYLWGDADAYFCRQPAVASADQVLGPYRFVEIEGGGHWLPELNAEVVNRELVMHLKSASARDR